MPTQDDITRKTIAAIASVDNDEYTFEQISANQALLIWKDLGLGPNPRRFCGRILNRYLRENGKKPVVKLDDLVKPADSVKMVIDKVAAALAA